MLPFEKQFNIVSTNNNEFKSQKQTYRCFSSFKEPFSYSNVYEFSKQYINYLTHLFSNSCKTISLYVIQNNDIKHQIFYLTTDELDNTIKKEKFNEDIEILPPFDIYFQVETINIPIQFASNTPKKVLRPTFKIKRDYTPRTYDGTVEKRLYFYTKRIESAFQTKEEVYNLCIPYLTNFQCLYKKDRINGNQITKSCYEISLSSKTENESIYYCEIDTDGDYIEEVKIYERLNPIIRKPYKIQLTISLIYDPQIQHETEYDTQTEIEELQLRLHNLRNDLEAYQDKAKTTNKCTREETCCICLTNPSNIIFTDCGHICICELCNKNIKELKCPLCRTSATQPRLII